MKPNNYQGEHQDCGEVCQAAKSGTVDDVRADHDGRPHHRRYTIDYQQVQDKTEKMNY